MHVIGDDHRYRICRQFQRYGAGRGNGHVCRGKGRTLGLGCLDDPGADRPVCRQAFDHGRHRPQRGQHDLDLRMHCTHPVKHAADHRGKTGHLAPARSRQGKNQRPPAPKVCPERLCLGGTGAGGGHHRMPDKITGHPGGGHIGRLERQQGQHMIDHMRHLRSAAGAPGPDRGRDIMDGAQVRAGGAHDPGNAQHEIRAVDGDQRIRCRRQHIGGGLPDAALQMGVFRQHFGQAHDRKLFHRKQAVQPFGLHQRASDSPHLQIGPQRFQPSQQRRPQRIARGFTSYDIQFHALRDHRNRPDSCAAAIVAARSSSRMPPAAHAMPARPAAAACATVAGPMAGRSTRRSWPGFGAL